MDLIAHFPDCCVLCYEACKIGRSLRATHASVSNMFVCPLVTSDHAPTRAPCTDAAKANGWATNIEAVWPRIISFAAAGDGNSDKDMIAHRYIAKADNFGSYASVDDVQVTDGIISRLFTPDLYECITRLLQAAETGWTSARSVVR